MPNWNFRICFCKFPTSILPLVDVRTLLHYLYTCWVQPYLLSLPYSGLGWSFPDISMWKLYCVNLYYINIFKLRTYELSYSVVHKILLRLRYKLSKLVGLVKTDLTVC